MGSSRLFCGLSLLAFTAACQQPPPNPGAPVGRPPSQDAAAAAPVVVTVLYTADEHGWLLPVVEKGISRGGAANALAQWMAEEKHCPGMLPEPDATASARRAAEQALEACTSPSTVLLSGGDNWTGPAIASFYDGLPMAEAMARMGYTASAFGNHEFDFGRDSFLRNRAVGGFPYLAANLHVVDQALEAEMTLPSHLLVERRGVKIGVVGLATTTTLKTARASRFRGLTFEAEEPALARAIPEAWQAGADAVVVIAHECTDKLEPILARHPEWNVSFVGAGHCHKQSTKSVRGVPLISPGWRLHTYARIRLTIDKTRPRRERVIAVEPELVGVQHPEAAPLRPPDPSTEQRTSVWKSRIDAVLGEQIGFAATGFESKSTEAGRWITQAWRAELGVDVAIINRGGIRQALGKGPITKNHVYSVLPFDNRLVVLSLRGDDLRRNLLNAEAIATGVRWTKAGGFVDDQGRPIDPDRKYSVATIDFLYFGGDGFTFEEDDPAPQEIGLDWRTPVIAWTTKLHTSPAAPLERALAPLKIPK